VNGKFGTIGFSAWCAPLSLYVVTSGRSKLVVRLTRLNREQHNNNKLQVIIYTHHHDDQPQRSIPAIVLSFGRAAIPSPRVRRGWFYPFRWTR